MPSSEHEEQTALFNWAAWEVTRYPELDLMFAIPNGGKRHPATAVKMKQEGVKPGVPDIFLPVPRGKYHGLFIEMKFGKNKPTEAQLQYIEALKFQGYKAVVCYSAQDAKQVILNYLNSGRAEEGANDGQISQT